MISSSVHKRYFTRGLAALAGLTILLAAVTLPASAATRNEPTAPMEVSEAKPNVQQRFFPGVAGQNSLFLPTPDLCSEPDPTFGCDLVHVRFVAPPGVGDTDHYSVTLKLTWPNQALPEGVTTSNDLDFYLWEGIDTDGDGEVDDYVEVNHAASADPEEKMGVIDIPTGLYYATIQNFSGANQEYTIHLAWTREILPDLPTYQPPERGSPVRDSAPPPSSSSSRPTSGTSMPRGGGAAIQTLPSPEPSPVKTPGPDGEPVDQALTAFAGETRFENVDDYTPIIVVGILLLLLAAGTAFYILRTKRKRGAQEA